MTSIARPAHPVRVTPIEEEHDQPTETRTVDTILANFLHPQELKHNIYIPRFQHRIAIVRAWDILSLATTPKGADATGGTDDANPRKPKRLHILDIGCGHGESAATLASLLLPHMDAAHLHITGVDNAHPDYGTPYTLTEAQAHLTASALGRCISFRRGDATTFFSSSSSSSSPPSSPSPPPGAWPADTVDAVTLCHCLWYFPTPQSVADLFATLARARVPRVYLAEYSFCCSLPGGVQDAHVLATRAQALLHASALERAAAAAAGRTGQAVEQSGPRAPNVRAALGVGGIVKAAAGAGWAVRREGTLVPAADMIEGHLEARLVARDAFSEVVRAEGLAPDREREVLGYVEGVREAVGRLAEAGVGSARAMDVWWAELELVV